MEKKADIRRIEAGERTEETAGSLLAGADGVPVPGGSGEGGAEGKSEAARYARTHGVPYPGICPGIQTAVIEFARNVPGLPGADSGAFAPDGFRGLIRACLEVDRQ